MGDSPKFFGITPSGNRSDRSAYVELSIDDFNFVDRYNDTTIAYHTKKGLFLSVNSLEGMFICLEKYGFTNLDSTNVTNLKNIESVDASPYGISVHFPNGMHTTVSRYKYKKFLTDLPKKPI
ncbi:LytTR family transcriptional regulator DNA-binding domain-containing protein [Brevibacillus laterosporus]|uniref:LytTR family transcriptional regulator DNA-binding domain-containing protein n=1 Tax=Brevibacillus TaxID=55080 RepID=UPI0037BF97B3